MIRSFEIESTKNHGIQRERREKMLVLFLGIVIGNSAKSVKCNRQPRREFEVYAWPLNRDPHLYPLENITTIAQWKGSKNNHFFHENGIR